MTSFNWKKSIGDTIKDGMIIRAATTKIFFALQAGNVKSLKACLEAMGIIKVARQICGSSRN